MTLPPGTPLGVWILFNDQQLRAFHTKLESERSKNALPPKAASEMTIVGPYNPGSATHAPDCASFDFDPEVQLGSDKPCDCGTHEASKSAAAMRRVLESWVELFENGRPKLHEFNETYVAACALLGREAKDIG